MNSIRSLTERRDRIIDQIRKIQDDIPNIKNTQLVRAKIDRSVTLVQQYDEVEKEIIILNASLAKSKRIAIDNERDVVNYLNDNITAFGYALDDSSNAGNNSTLMAPPAAFNNSPLQPSYLKPIELPKFVDSNFEHFWAVFTNLVDDNPTLAPVIKFHYLVNCLSESAKAVISEFFPISDKNYGLAKDALIKQYDNPRRGASKHVMDMLNCSSLGNNPSGTELASLVRTFKNSISALDKMQIPNLLDFVYFQILYNKLDKQTRMAFDNSVPDLKAVRSVADLTKFIQSKVQVAELDKIASATTPKKVTTTTTTTTSSAHVQKSAIPKSVLLTDTATAQPKVISCEKCQAEHRLYQCEEFKTLSLDDKFKVVKENKSCHNCLRKHGFAKCNKSQFRCLHCSAKGHHSLLCKKKFGTNNAGATVNDMKPTNVTEPVAKTSDVMACMGSKGVSALLATALVLVKAKDGNPVLLRAIIDNASEQTFICENAAQQLGHQRSNDSTLIRGIGGTVKSRGRIEIEISSRDNEFTVATQALILNQICKDLPSNDFENVSELQGLDLADPMYNQTGPVQLLLGTDIYAQIISSTRPLIKVGGLVFLYTSLGYIVNGTIDAMQSEDSSALLSLDDSLNDAVQRLWQLEEFPKVKHLSPEEQAAEDYYVATTKRDKSGRYIVRLPFKADAVPLVENKYSPMQYYLRVEKKLNQTPEAAKLYHGVFSDYVKNGMMKESTTHSKYLLLHHAVLKETSSTTKIRPVFNGSAPDKNGHSLNDQLLTGAPLQADITDILFRFRIRPVPLICDIKRMYNSILVHPDDCKFQHLLWRPSPDEEVREYENCCVMFGNRSSAFLAQRTVQQIVKDYGESYPLGAEILAKSCYVDDCLASFPDVDTALKAKNELVELMGKGKFELRKFASSYRELLNDMNPEHLEDVDFEDESSSIKLLGLRWGPKLDSFHYSAIPYSGPVTKRQILKWTAHLFDPDGMLTPFTVGLKMFLKELWRTHHDWDTEVSTELKDEWLSFVTEFPLLEEICLNRYIPVYSCDRVELIAFSDGSSKGYGTCMYLRCVFGSKAEMYLIRSKGKVTSLKPLLTIPRAELQAANMLAELYHSMQDVLSEIPIAATHFCIDSTILKYWLLKTPINKLQLFCANRVSNIRSKTSGVEWHHVPSSDNASDPASRSLSPKELISCDLWWNGPAFLREEPVNWPEVSNEDIEIPELKEEKTVLITQDPSESIEAILTRFSSLSRLQCVIGWIKRFQFNCLASKRQTETRSGPLKSFELQEALQIMIRQVQNESYADLIAGKEMPKNIQCLTPFVNELGLVVVGGRIDKAKIIPQRARHPFLLPKESHLSLLICREAHITTLHGGPLIMRSTVQARFWILGITRIVKKVHFQCRTCYTLKAKLPTPMMAELPETRFADVRPFLNVSIDFAGFFTVHEGSRPRARMIKVYICIFTCMSTRAIHLEVVQDLTTESFLASVSRFISRRGLCALLYCDNGTNFQGADKKLNEIKTFLTENGSDIEKLLALQQISFQFISPLSPWKNGITERFCGLCKQHLYRVMKTTTLTFTEFQTLVTRCEAVLNSRPLIPLSVHPQDGILTPSHFIIGAPMLDMPEADLTNVKMNSLTRWQIVRSCLRKVWDQWRNCYVQTLIKRSKWLTPCPPISVGTVVVMKSDNTPPLVWPLAIVTELLPHSDKVIRVVKVRTASGLILIRPVNKLLPLNAE